MRRETILRILLVLLILVLAAFIFYNMTSPLAIYPEEAKEMLKKGDFPYWNEKAW